MTSLGKVPQNLADTTAMLLERFPEMRPQIEARLAEAQAEIDEAFRPMIDFAEGRIDQEEYLRIMDDRQAATIARRFTYWQGLGQEGPIYAVRCETCHEEWNADELGEPPPEYFECSDLDDESCQEEDDEDEWASSWLPVQPSDD
jgi:hypothetical protein